MWRRKPRLPLWGQREPEGFRGIFLGKLHLEEDLGSGRFAVPFPVFWDVL